MKNNRALNNGVQTLLNALFFLINFTQEQKTMKISFTLLFFSVFLLGCSQGMTRVSIQGTVTFEGKPLDNASVFIRPEAGPDADARTDSSGRYVIPKEAGPMPGNVQIMVEKYSETEVKGGDGKMSPISKPALPPNIQSKLKPYILKKGKNQIDLNLDEW
jgi:hypothetical protein